jgi:hypothetical protein
VANTCDGLRTSSSRRQSVQVVARSSWFALFEDDHNKLWQGRLLAFEIIKPDMERRQALWSEGGHSIQILFERQGANLSTQAAGSGVLSLV